MPRRSQEDVMQAHPKLGDVLSLLEGLLDNAAMQLLNFKGDGKKRRLAEVARELLKEKGLF
jgi:glycine betaine/choline ABC-type transport system substrate-binding protein